MCTWKEWVFFCFWVEGPINIYKSIWSNASFRACVSLLIFCLDDLSIAVSGMLNSPLLLCYCQFLLLRLLAVALCIEVILCWVRIYFQFSSSWIDPLIIGNVLLCLLWYSLRSVLSDISITTPPFFWFPFAWNVFFRPLFCFFSIFVPHLRHMEVPRLGVELEL